MNTVTTSATPMIQMWRYILHGGEPPFGAPLLVTDAFEPAGPSSRRPTQGKRKRRRGSPKPRAATPFVKWIGGKTQLLRVLLPLLRTTDGVTYHEPFLGGGAVFFGLCAEGSARRARLSDAMPELITTYGALRDNPAAVIAHLHWHRAHHAEAYFKGLRAEQPTDSAAVAARFIYLNKAGFNGMHRVNRQGVFNVPWGKHENPTVFDEENLRAVSAALDGVNLRAAPFEVVLDDAHAGDVVYFDPPYLPMSATANFTGYTARAFCFDDHQRLAAVVRELTKRSVRVVLSNSDTPQARGLYDGFRIAPALARRSVNSRGDRRGPVPEIIVTNF